MPKTSSNGRRKASRNPVLLAIRQHRGLAVRIASEIGLTPEAVWMWCQYGRVPPQHVIAVERVTGIARSAIRPDIYPPPTRRSSNGQASRRA